MKKMKTQKDFSSGGVPVEAESGRVLLVKVQNLSGAQVWTFPKGHPEPKESDTEAALREVKEETGWDCRVVRLLTDLSYFFVQKGVRTHKTVRWFLMEPVAKTGRFMEGEILDCRWFTRDEAIASVTYDSDKKLLELL